MGCAILPETSRPHAEINVTPLIDVLLIIFMIGLPVVKRDLPLALSSKTKPEVVRAQPVTLCLDAAGSLYLHRMCASGAASWTICFGPWRHSSRSRRRASTCGRTPATSASRT